MTAAEIKSILALIFTCVVCFGCSEKVARFGSGSTIGIEEQHSDSKLIFLKDGIVVPGFPLSDFFENPNGGSVYRSLPDIQPLFVGQGYICFVVWNFPGNTDKTRGLFFLARNENGWKRILLETINVNGKSLLPHRESWVGIREGGQIFRVTLDRKNGALLFENIDILNELKWESFRPGKGPNFFLAKSKDDEWYRISSSSRGEFGKIRISASEQQDVHFHGLELFSKEYSKNRKFRGMPLVGAFFDQSSETWILTTTSNDMTDTIYSFDPKSGKSTRITEGYFSRWYPLPICESEAKVDGVL